MHRTKPKNSHQWTKIFAKSRKPHFWGIFGHFPQNKNFSKKSGSVWFLPLKHPNIMKSFKKNPINRFWEKVVTDLLKYWPTDIPTYWPGWNHRTPFHLKAGGQNQYIMVNFWYLEQSTVNRWHLWPFSKWLKGCVPPTSLVLHF